MKIQIVLYGLIKNKVIEKEAPESSLVSTIAFINENGLYAEDCWYPTTRIKEIRYEYPAAEVRSKVFLEETSKE